MRDKHSRGPWKRTQGVLGVQSAGGLMILCIDDFGLPAGECVANANLVSAAPELLDVCMSIENDDGSIPAPLWAMRNAAIAKARGQS